MSWLHYLAWTVFAIVAIKAIWFGWRHATLVSKVLDEAGATEHRKKHIRPLTEAERRAVLNTPNPRQRGRQRVIDPERLTDSDLNDLDDMFS